MKIIKDKYFIFSVMGPHAGESEKEIFERKIKDIENIGITFWLHNSHQAKSGTIRQFATVVLSQQAEILVYFVEPSTRDGAIPTKIEQQATHYADANGFPKPFPAGLSPVTGKIQQNTCALILDELRVIQPKTEYIVITALTNYNKQELPFQIQQGGSTICCIQNTHSKSNEKLRAVVAIGRLTEPYGSILYAR